MNPAHHTFNLGDFPSQTFDKLRYADTDRQGHVNNACFATFFETGRVEILYDSKRPILEPGASFVIASLQLDFLNEITWPGRVEIGTGVITLGRSSLTLYQALFQNHLRVAQAQTVIVQVGENGSVPLGEKARSVLQRLVLSTP